MKRNLFAIFLALTLVVALAFVIAPTAKAETETPMTVVKATGTSLPEGFNFGTNILDLNGNKVEVEVPSGKTLSVINTAIREINGVISNAGELTNIGTGSIAPVAQDPASKVRFLAVGADNVYTFYPFSLELSQQGINTLAKNPDNENLTEPAACIRVSFMAFSPLFDKIEEYGFIVDGKEYSVKEKFNKNVTDLYADLLGSLRGKMGEDKAKIDTAKPVQGYMVVAGKTYETDLLEFTPRNILKGINKNAKLNLTDNQKTAIEKLFADDNYGRVKNILTRFQESKTTDITLSFANADNRVSQDSNSQEWSFNGLTFINKKTSDSNAVVSNVNPVRLYKNSIIEINATDITRIVFNCVSEYAALGLTDTADYTVVTEGLVTTVTFTAPVDSFVTTLTAGQVRLNSLTVTSDSTQHTHHGGTATCIDRAVCIDCDNEYGGVDANNHKDDKDGIKDHICDRDGCNEKVGEHIDKDGDTVCDYGCSEKIEVGSAVPKTYTYNFTSQVFSTNGTKKLGDVSWTLAGNGGYWGYDGTKGQQFGSGSKPYKSLTLTSDSFSNVKSIKINTSGAKSVNASFTVSVGGTQVGSSTKVTTSATTYTFTPDEALTGEVVFTYTQTSSKALYIKSITIEYAE